MTADFVAKPFTVSFPADEVEDFHRRLDSARWPAQDVVPETTARGEGTAFGMGVGPSLKLMKELAKEWRNFDPEALEKHLNSFNHFTVEIEGLSIHFLHHASPRADATPLVLCHGWPGGFHEFLHTIPLLTSPSDASQPAFHVVVPSMPGYAWSSAPPRSDWVMDDTARVFNKVMLGLGYDSYVSQGGDWGSITARCLGALFKENCKATHLNFCPTPAPWPLNKLSPQTLVAYMPTFLLGGEQKLKQIQRGIAYLEKGSAYNVMQTLTPRTPAYGLNDSPIGLLAWIGEKIYPSIEKAQGPNPTMNRAALYTTVSIYWFNTSFLHLFHTTHANPSFPSAAGSIGSSFLPYALNPYFTTYLTDPKYHLPRLAVSGFPRELIVPNDRDSARTGNLVWSKQADDGGHFAALEKPEVFVEHLREAVPVLLKA
ncbi:hypothetical protein JCM8547_004978 [Rhodosporidiobolus lusitaniae]